MSESAPTDRSPIERSPAGSNVPAPVPQIISDHIGAVPAIWGDQQSGPLTATLAFRVGEADERLRTRGRCHLVRALVLDALADHPDVAITASVRTLGTRFTVTGDDPAVVAALNAVTGAITTLRTDRLESSISGVLDSWTPPRDWDSRLMSLRFGSRGYGLPALPLLGLVDFDRDAFTDWVRTWFNAHNAVISANRQPPDGLNLAPLGDGMHKPLPGPRQLDNDLPGFATGEDHQLAFSLLTRFDAVTRLAFAILIDRLDATCRTIAPQMRRPDIETRRTGAGLATVAIAIDAPNVEIARLHAAVSADLFRLSMTGPTDDELGAAQIRLRRSRSGSGRATPTLVREVATDLLYRENRDVDAALRARPGDLAEILRTALPRAIWLVPDEVAVTDHRLIRLDDPSHPVTDGEDFARVPGPLASDGPIRLTIGADAIAVADSRRTTTVRFDAVVTAEVHEDGTRVLWSVDGAILRIDPSLWDGGDRIGALIDRRVEPWVILHGRVLGPSGPKQAESGQDSTATSEP